MRIAFVFAAFFFRVWMCLPATAQAVLPQEEAGTWVCTPCGKACDRITYATGGVCPHCTMGLVPRTAATNQAVEYQALAAQQEVMGASVWPLALEMRVPFEPTAFPSGRQNHLLYELYLTNFGPTPLLVSRLEVLNPKAGSPEPLATYSTKDLDAMLQLPGQLPATDHAQQFQLAAGQTAIVFLEVVLSRAAPLPERLVHRLHTASDVVEGALIETRHTPLQVLAPPVDGADWLAADGPGNGPDNHHRRGVLLLNGQALDSRRYAIDWKQVREGRSFAGDARKVQAYYCYGKAVRAVAAGRVVAAQDGLADNVPGHGEHFRPAVPITLETVAGNRITLALGSGQYAHYLHLQPGSVRVKVGERVRRGQVLALIGNSGDAREPHLHFEVTTSPTLLRGEGIPYVIDRYRTRVEQDNTWEQHQRQLPLDRTIVDFGPGQDQ